jgi:hypothetical protein
LPGSIRDQPALLLGERCVEVEHEGIRIRTELSHDERHPLSHQTCNESNIT